MSTAIIWFLRNLRLADNGVLATAVANHDRVVPVFVVDPRQVNAPEAGPHALAFLFGAVASLDADLRARHGYFVVREGDPLAELSRLAAETGAARIYAQDDVSRFRAKPRRGRRGPAAALAPARHHRPPSDGSREGGRLAVHSLHAVQPGVGGNAGTNGERSPRRAQTRAGAAGPHFQPAAGLRPASRVATLSADRADRSHLLRAFVSGSGLADYATERDRLDRVGTSHLSRDLRFGLVSAREAVVAAIVGRDGAAMRELADTGWIHNRARLIVASFPVKDRLLDWRLGERHFRQQLIDGDPAANSGNWQWVAGVSGPMPRRTSGSSTRRCRAASSTRPATTSAGGFPGSLGSRPLAFTPPGK